MQEAFLEVRQAVFAAGLAGLEHDHGTTGLVVSGVKPVAQLEGVIGVRLVDGVIVKMVNGDVKIIGWVEKRRIGVTLYKSRGTDCVPLFSCQILPALGIFLENIKGSGWEVRLTRAFLSTPLSREVSKAALTTPKSA